MSIHAWIGGAMYVLYVSKKNAPEVGLVREQVLHMIYIAALSIYTNPYILYMYIWHPPPLITFRIQASQAYPQLARFDWWYIRTYFVIRA